MAPSTLAPAPIDLNTTPVAGGSSSGGARKRVRQMRADVLSGACNLFNGMPAAGDEDYMQNLIFEGGVPFTRFDPDETQRQNSNPIPFCVLACVPAAGECASMNLQEIVFVDRQPDNAEAADHAPEDVVDPVDEVPDEFNPLAIVPYQQPIFQPVNLMIGAVRVAYGPPLPPVVSWTRSFEALMGVFSSLHVPRHL
ncbi:DNA repair protein rhp54 [Hordeum vulgare]|nr:DNA repair protein rhp54 [Hordeum vulgare]